MTKRTRNYASVTYPDSAPDDWIIRLDELHIPALISPLHDKDTNPDGTLKKPHFHVMLMFEGNKTSEQAKKIFDTIGGVGLESVHSCRSYARYLCHLDNPEKAQYNPKDVICCAGADYEFMIALSSDKYTAIAEMIDFCVQKEIVSYATLLLYAREQRPDWFKILCDSGAVTMVTFLKSRYWETYRYEKE